MCRPASQHSLLATEADVVADIRIGQVAWAVDLRRYGDESDRGSINPSGLLAESRIFLKHRVHLFVDHGVDRGAVIEFFTNLVGSGDERRQIIDEGNLILFEQRHKLILLVLLAWVGACRAGAKNCGSQHHRSADQSVCKAGNAAAHVANSTRATTGRPSTTAMSRHSTGSGAHLGSRTSGRRAERAAASANALSPLIAVSGGGWPLRRVAISSR